MHRVLVAIAVTYGVWGRVPRAIADDAAPAAAAIATFLEACGRGDLSACDNGLRLPALPPEAQAALRAQACYHGQDAACAGLSLPTVGAKVIALRWPSVPLRSIVFVGRDGHALLAHHDDQVALLDPTRGIAAAWRRLASETLPGVRTSDPDRAQRFRTAAWRWDAAARTLVGLIALEREPKDDGVAVWSPATPRAPTVAFPIPSRGGVLAWSPDGRIAIVRNELGQPGARVIELASRRDVAPAVADSVATSTAFAADGRRAAIGTIDGRIAVYALDRGTLAEVRAPAAASHGRAIRSLSFHPTRAMLAGTNGDGPIRIWDTADLARPPRLIAEPGRWAVFSPDGRYLAVIGPSQAVLLDATSFRRVMPAIALQASSPGAVAFSPDSRFLAVVDNDAGVDVLDLTPRVPSPPTDTGWFRALRRLPVPAPPPSPPFGRTTVTGQITHAGAPIAGAEVQLRPVPWEWPNARTLPARTIRTDLDGSFALHDVAEIEWTVTASTPASTVARSMINLRTPGAVTRIELALEPALRVRGTVIDAAGRPVAGARIGGWFANHTSTDVVTDRAGAFTLDHQPPDTTIHLHGRGPRGEVSPVADVKPSDQASVTLRLRPPEDPEVVRVRVVDRIGRPVPGAQVGFLINDSVDVRATDSSGMTSIVLTGARTTISVDHPRLWSRSIPITMPHAGVVTMTLEPRPE